MTATLPHAPARPDAAEHPEPLLPFSDQLRKSTRAAHVRAESSPFVGRLMAGQLDVDAFARLTGQLWFVYEALESVVTPSRIPSAVADPRLRRLMSLETDLRHLRGARWRETLAALPATRAYADRIRAVAGTASGYLAHHYTRYLGDLSGGQVVARLVARHYGLHEEQPGLLFYRFEQIPRPKPFKDAYRRAVDDAGWDTAARADTVAEADRAFALNAAVFADLA